MEAKCKELTILTDYSLKEKRANFIRNIIDNLLNFYCFDNKIIISVGAGGGQFIEYGRKAKQVFAIDNNEQALIKLNENLIKSGLVDKFILINNDFYQSNLKADVLIFEFCLHEMTNTELAINHAKTMAKDIVITDHLPNSEWAYIVDENEKVKKSWAAIEHFNLKNIQKFEAIQEFNSYEELYQKVKSQGKNAIDRIQQFKNCKNISIPMQYSFTLID